jgi:hypothetical protein
MPCELCTSVWAIKPCECDLTKVKKTAHLFLSNKVDRLSVRAFKALNKGSCPCINCLVKMVCTSLRACDEHKTYFDNNFYERKLKDAM